MLTNVGRSLFAVPSAYEIQLPRVGCSNCRKGLPVGYLLFQGEGHGFRKAENIKRALDAELLFYAVNVFRVGLTF